MTVDASGNLYFTVETYHRVYKVTPAGDLITFAGIGVFDTNPYLTPEQANRVVGKKANEVQFTTPKSLAIDSQNNMYIAERSTGQVIKVNLLTNEIIDIYGFSLQSGAKVEDIALDSSGNLYIYSYTESQNIKTYYLGKLNVDELDASYKTFTSITDIDFSISDNRFVHMAVDSQGDLYFSRVGSNSAILKYSFSSGQLTTFVSGTGGLYFNTLDRSCSMQTTLHILQRPAISKETMEIRS